MAENEAIVKKAYEDFAKGDVPAVLAVLDGDIRWFEAEGNPHWQGGPWIGPQQIVEQVFTRIMQDFDGFTITVNRIVGLGDTVVMEGRYNGSGRVSGRPLDAQTAHVWDLRDGMAVRFQQYVDTAQLQHALDVWRASRRPRHVT
jgi:ketosteroid isomerase-like protein